MKYRHITGHSDILEHRYFKDIKKACEKKEILPFLKNYGIDEDVITFKDICSQRLENLELQNKFNELTKCDLLQRYTQEELNSFFDYKVFIKYWDKSLALQKRLKNIIKREKFYNPNVMVNILTIFHESELVDSFLTNLETTNREEDSEVYYFRDGNNGNNYYEIYLDLPREFEMTEEQAFKIVDDFVFCNINKKIK